MAEEYLSTDPNAGLQDEYISTDPNAGIEEPSGGIVSSVVSEGKRLAGQAVGLLNPIHLLQGALDIQPRSGLQEVMRTGRLLKDIVGGTPVGEAIQKEAPDVYEQQQAILGNRGTEAQRETLRGIGTQLGMVAAPFIHGKVVPLRGKVPTLGEVVNGEAAAPEAMPQTPEPPISEVAAQQTQTIPEAVPKVEEVIPNAEQIQGPARANVDVQLPGGAQAREGYGGEMPADVGGERVPPRGQGETLQQTPQEVAPDWLRQNQSALNDIAEKSGVADKIEELAAQRLNANQIGERLGIDAQMVRAVRNARGIPPVTEAMNFGGGVPVENPEFTNWLANRTAKPTEVAAVPSEQPVSHQETISLLEDAIATKRANNQKVPDSMIQRLGELKALEAGTTTENAVFSNESVPSHPSNSENPVLPIKLDVSQQGLDSIAWRGAEAQKRFDIASEKLKTEKNKANRAELEVEQDNMRSALKELGRMERIITSKLSESAAPVPQPEQPTSFDVSSGYGESASKSVLSTQDAMNQAIRKVGQSRFKSMLDERLKSFGVKRGSPDEATHVENLARKIVSDWPNPIFGRDEITVMKPRKGRNFVDVDVRAPLISRDDFFRLSDDSKLSANVSALIKEGKTPKKADPVWSVRDSKGNFLARNLTYKEAVESAKDHVHSANPTPESDAIIAEPPSQSPKGGEQIPLVGQPKPTEVGSQVGRPEQNQIRVAVDRMDFEEQHAGAGDLASDLENIPNLPKPLKKALDDFREAQVVDREEFGERSGLVSEYGDILESEARKWASPEAKVEVTPAETTEIDVSPLLKAKSEAEATPILGDLMIKAKTNADIAKIKTAYEQWKTGTKTEPPPPAAPPPVETAVAPEAPQKASKIGKSIEAKAVEAKLTEGFKDTAGYDPITIKDQAERATRFVKESPTDARAVIRGDAALPEGLRGTSLITAMEEELIRKPDAKLAYELANSPLVSETSAAAQEMRLMSERVPDSLAAKFSEIKEARKAGSKLRGETTESVFQEIRQEIVRQSSKRPTWEAFVKSIEC